MKKNFDRENMNFLKQSLKNPQRALLLFRASQHGFNNNKFHEFCDGKGDTLTIIRT